MSHIVRIDGENISDWDTFHDVFAKAFGFPGFYGHNMNAWIDCMSTLSAPEEGMTQIHVPAGEVVALVIENAGGFKKQCPEQYAALVECSAFVNWRLIEVGEPVVLSLAFYV